MHVSSARVLRGTGAFVLVGLAAIGSVYEWRVHRTHVVIYRATAAGCGPMTIRYHATASETGNVATFGDDHAQGSWRSPELRFKKGDHLYVHAEIDARASSCSNVTCEILADGVIAAHNATVYNGSSCGAEVD